jgi:hypothetical protein
MSLRLASRALLALALAACSDKDATSPQPTVLTDAPATGGSLTIAGASGLSGASAGAIAGSVGGNPYALVAAGSRTLPPPPICTPAANGITSCAITLNGLNIAYAFGWLDSLGLRTESQMSGTIPAADGQPERRIRRQGVSWTLPLNGGSNPMVAMRHRSTENGTYEEVATPRVVSADTGSADVRVVIGPFGANELRIPRMVGTSRRVTWTSRGGAPATFWRETTTYDSSTVIRSVIETPTETRRCSIDLAATVIALTCR